MRALIVDDEENVAYVVATALRRDGWDTAAVDAGAKVRTAIDEFGPDVIVLDVMLPDANGYDLCQQLRHEGLLTPVIFLTARDAAEDRVRGLTIGGDDYLTKPFSVEELLARCRLLFRRSAAQPSEVLSYADLEMDDAAHLVRRGERIVSLSPTEYKLLRYLLMNSERVLSRNQILDHVWDYDFGGESSNVESYISFLRRKVDCTDPKLIHTVRSIGYVMRTEGG